MTQPMLIRVPPFNKDKTSLARFAAVLLVLTVNFSGCGPSSEGPPRYKVTGTVTFQGTAIAQGDILFFDEQTRLPPDAGQINEGKYSVNVTAGLKKVRISASREVPGKTRLNASKIEVPLREEYVPAQYNAQTQLTAEVTPDGANEFDFHLE